MRRQLVWIAHFAGWGCSECAWVFNPANVSPGNSFTQMLGNFEELRDKEFALHVCAEHPKGKSAVDKKPE